MTISCSYADHGKEILELLRKNPAVAIPLILRRLKDKDTEWRQVVEGLNKSWRDTMQKNYYKSLDFMSFQFKRDDPKMLSSKVLLQKAHARAGKTGVFNSPGPISAEQAIRSAFGTVLLAAQQIAAASSSSSSSSSSTSSSSSSSSTANAPNTATASNASAASSSSSSSVKDTYRWVYSDLDILRDIYQLQLYAVEHASNVSADHKTQIADMWERFFQPFFALPKGFLEQSNNNNARPTLEDSSRSIVASALSDDVEQLQAPLLQGAACITNCGNGTVKDYDATKKVYAVEFPFATGYIHRANVKRARQAPPSSTSTATSNSSDSSASADTESTNDSATSTAPSEESVRLPFLGNKHAYLYLHAHHVLYTRLVKAKQLCKDRHRKAGKSKSSKSSNTSTSPSNPMELLDESAAQHAAAAAPSPNGWEGDYKSVLAACFALLDGSLELNRFEDLLRLLLGSDGFELFTMDRLTALSTKQLNYLTQSSSQELFDLHHETVAKLKAGQSANANGNANDSGATDDIMAEYTRTFLSFMRDDKDTEGFWCYMDTNSSNSPIRTLRIRCLPVVAAVKPSASSPASIDDSVTTPITPASDSSATDGDPASSSSSSSPTGDNAEEVSEEQPDAKRIKIENKNAAAADNGGNNSTATGSTTHESKSTENGDADDDEDERGRAKRIRIEKESDDQDSSSAAVNDETAPAPAPRLTRSMRSRH